MDYKRHTAALSVIFVLVEMIFLVPAITDKALARVEGSAISSIGSFSHVSGQMSAGRFAVRPINLGNEIIWATIGNGPIGGGNERGFVSANVAGAVAIFHFSNPARGDNTCSVGGTIPHTSRCTITQGVFSRARYFVTPP